MATNAAQMRMLSKTKYHELRRGVYNEGISSGGEQPLTEGTGLNSIIRPCDKKPNTATKEGSISLGEGTRATGKGAFCTGDRSTASGNFASAEGVTCSSSGDYSRSQGVSCSAEGYGSFASGTLCLAEARYSQAVGVGCTTVAEGQVILGSYPEVTADTLFAVGNGTSFSARSNAIEVRIDGSIYFMGQKFSPGSSGGDTGGGGSDDPVLAQLVLPSTIAANCSFYYLTITKTVMGSWYRRMIYCAKPATYMNSGDSIVVSTTGTEDTDMVTENELNLDTEMYRALKHDFDVYDEAFMTNDFSENTDADCYFFTNDENFVTKCQPKIPVTIRLKPIS